MADHTPGPWELKAESEHLGGRVRKLQVLASHGLAGNRELFCRFGPDDTDKANARLIAAAPELLAALEDLVQCSPDDIDSWGFNDALAKARAAIAKAKGI